MVHDLVAPHLAPVYAHHFMHMQFTYRIPQTQCVLLLLGTSGLWRCDGWQGSACSRFAREVLACVLQALLDDLAKDIEETGEVDKVALVVTRVMDPAKRRAKEHVLRN